MRLLFLCVLWFAAPATAASAAGAPACAGLARVQQPGLRITGSEWVTQAQPDIEALGPMPPHCRVTGVLDERHGVPAPLNMPEGQRFSDLYGIHFELRLPETWSGRFYYEGGGGSDGVVKPAIGHIPGLANRPGYSPALYRGFAVVTSDAGHSENQNTGFGMDPRARLDYAYASIPRVRGTARALITAFYGRQPRFSYFAGCSKGGQEAMEAMQRDGAAFDGIIAGAPGYRLPLSAVAEVWDTRALAAAAPAGPDGKPDLPRAFSGADLKLVADAVVRQCGGQDGTDDSLITRPQDCRFDPAVLQCHAGGDDRCITEAQVTALHTVFGGVRAGGAQVYPGWFYDSGIASPNWRAWKLGSATRPALNVAIGGASLRYVFLTPPGQDFDMFTTPVEQVLAGVKAVSGIYTTPSVTFMTADDTRLTAFRAHHGRMILYHGTSDPVFSAQDTIGYYDAIKQRHGAATADFARLFLVPGMTHCGGGDFALDSFDTLDAVTAWVEHGHAPDRLVATAAKGSGSGLKPGISRPLCPYPRSSQYRGSGDPDDAGSFVCQ